MVMQEDQSVEMEETKDIEKKEEGYAAEVEGKTLFLPNAELINIGCRNCVWRLHGQCPHHIEGDELFECNELPKSTDSISSSTQLKGICPEMIQFVLSLAEKDDSVSALWEKFHIYKARLQESEDYADFLRLRKEIKKLSEECDGEDDEKKLAKLRMDKNSAKLWWVKLNEQVVKSLQKIADREVKKSEGGRMPGIHSTGTINFNIPQKIEDKSKNENN